MFVPALSLIEVIVRGTIMYLALFAILRFIGRRQAGHFGPADLLVIVLIADAAQNALGKDYQSVTEGIVLVCTIVGWEYTLDWLAWRFPALRNILKAPPSRSWRMAASWSATCARKCCAGKSSWPSFARKVSRISKRLNSRASRVMAA